MGVDTGLAILVQGFLFAIGSLKYIATSLSNIWVAVINANIVIPLGFVLGFVAVTYGLLYAFILHVIFNVIFDTVSTMTGGAAQ